MRRFRPLILATLLLAAALPVLAFPESAPDEPADRGRRLIDKYRADPERYARLERDFLALPADRQERIRQFDRALYDLPRDKRQRLWGVLQRYTAWVERLPEEDRKQIEAAGDRDERLRVVRRLREREFVERLPRAERDDFAKLPEAERPDRLAALRREERQRRLDWGLGVRPPPRTPKPAEMEEVQAFVEKQLRPALNEDDKEQLKEQMKNAEGKWPQTARLIQELSDRYLLPPLPSGQIVRWRQLPPEYHEAMPRIALERKQLWDNLQKQDGKWPQFALAVVEMPAKHKYPKALPTTPLGASRPEEFSPDVRAFIETKLTDDDRKQLHDAEGRWPEYPRLLHELARRRNLSIPGLSPPGPRDIWEGRVAP
jgi:hypothetical protein